MIGAPIFEFGLALLNAGFLDLEFGESGLGQRNGCCRGERGPKNACMSQEQPPGVQLIFAHSILHETE